MNRAVMMPRTDDSPLLDRRDIPPFFLTNAFFNEKLHLMQKNLGFPSCLFPPWQSPSSSPYSKGLPESTVRYPRFSAKRCSLHSMMRLRRAKLAFFLQSISFTLKNPSLHAPNTRKMSSKGYFLPFLAKKSDVLHYICTRFFTDGGREAFAPCTAKRAI